MASAPEPPLDVGRIRLLREVAVRGTIAGAARSLGLTASAVSQQLSALERETGAALLDRSPRGVVLTGAGHVLAERAAAILDLLAEARAELDHLSGRVSGPVWVAAVASAAASLVSDAICALRVEQPGVAVSVIAAEPARSLDLLLAGDVEIAVVDEYDYVPLALPDNVIGVELCAEPLVVVTPPGLVGDADGRPLTSLADDDWVMPPEDAACGHAVRSACRAAGFEPRVRWETDDMLLLVAAVAAGHGVAVLPRLSVSAQVASVDVRDLTEPPLHRRLIAVARSSAQARPVVQSVLAALRAAAARLEPLSRTLPLG
jgi:molybdate transport repressor ModE-like protein